MDLPRGELDSADETTVHVHLQPPTPASTASTVSTVSDVDDQVVEGGQQQADTDAELETVAGTGSGFCGPGGGVDNGGSPGRYGTAEDQ